MTRAELIALRDDALNVISTIYQTKPECFLNVDEAFASLTRATAMHSAACAQLRCIEQPQPIGKLAEQTPEEQDYLLDVEHNAMNVVKAWQRAAVMDANFFERFGRLITDLAELFPIEGGA